MITRTRIIREDRFWDIFQAFVDAGMTMVEIESSLKLATGYLRSVKSKKRIPKYSTYKAISDELRFRSGKKIHNQNGKPYPLITNDDLEFIIDPVYIKVELKKRKCSISSLAKFINIKDHTLAERLRYWEEKNYTCMRLDTLRDIETALRKWDDKQNIELSYEEPIKEKTWDFKAERLEFLKTGKLPTGVRDWR